MATYFVSTSGNDNNRGTEGSPWRAIQKGIDALNPGDTLYIRGGTYHPSDEGIGKWSVNKKRGTASDPITIQAYNNETVTLDGLTSSSVSTHRYPDGIYSTDNAWTAPDGGTYQWTYSGLVEITESSYVTFADIHVTKSGGRGIHVSGPNNELLGDTTSGGRIIYTSANTHHITIDGCTVSWCRLDGVVFRKCYAGILNDTNIYEIKYCKNAGSTATTSNSYACEMTNCVVHQSRGEANFGDANNQPNLFNKLNNNVFFDCDKPPYVHVGRDFEVIGNFLYHTNQCESHFEAFMGISMTPGETDIDTANLMARGVIANNILVCNNKISYGIGFVETYGAVLDIHIVHNTVINAKDASFHMQTPQNWTRCVFKNNISINSDAAKHVKLDNASGTGWDIDADYNLFNNVPTAGGVFVGNANDLIEASPLVSTAAMNRKANTYVLTPGYDDATPYQLQPSSRAINAGDGNVDTDIANNTNSILIDDYWGNRRGTVVDIGAHEFVSASIKGDFSASPVTGVAPLTVTFEDKSTASQRISSWFWDFGDGSISNEQNPTHDYKQGAFTVSLRVGSGGLSDIVTKKSFISVAAPEIDTPPRVTKGLSVLYRFDEGNGSIVYDVSGVGAPLDLTITDPSKIAWLNPGLQLVSPTAIVSIGPAEKINEACREANAITLEMWLKPTNTTQDGPARIASISRNVHSRNVTLGQGLWGTQPTDLFDVRLRTTERSANGMPSLSSPKGSAVTKIRHVVFTRAAGGRARIFINGAVVAEDNIPGNFETWNPRFPLLIGNESNGEFPWLGEVYLLAIYNRALTIDEIKTNRDAGRPVSKITTTSAISMAMFKRFVILSNNNSLLSETTEAFGVQYPDERCVVCASNGANSMAIFDDINKVLSEFKSPNVQLRWLD